MSSQPVDLELEVQQLTAKLACQLKRLKQSEQHTLMEEQEASNAPARLVQPTAARTRGRPRTGLMEEQEALSAPARLVQQQQEPGGGQERDLWRSRMF